ncbi:hypothetical protein F9C07_2262210 [Aspergillus flavus]|uniref:Uncharacterized protein n=2 Tax=Aspergillus subgen. Circumdati TaxID=2720871 RepID=A0A7U2MWM2_ASPFN|nr:hypothetical protein OAory_01088600 [Aspergillus oryzae]QRD91232.1 hypothetical protein F9C07_2262210 [Aspergillus flavus]
MSEETLENDADFGRLPFDNFSSQTNATFIRFCSGLTSAVQERWDFNAAGDSQEQWERLPYQYRDELSSPALGENIRRVLATHQTVHERNISLVSSEGLQTVWLRTCYDPDLARKYEELKQRSVVPGWQGWWNEILDDPARYDFDDGGEGSWRPMLVRVPGITDFYGLIDMDGAGRNMQYKSGQNHEEMMAQAEKSEEVWRDLALAEIKIQTGLYLLDRDSIESGLIKILWLDEHGNVAWHSRLDPSTSDFDGFMMQLLSATSLVELAGYDGTRGSLIER